MKLIEEHVHYTHKDFDDTSFFIDEDKQVIYVFLVEYLESMRKATYIYKKINKKWASVSDLSKIKDIDFKPLELKKDKAISLELEAKEQLDKDFKKQAKMFEKIANDIDFDFSQFK